MRPRPQPGRAAELPPVRLGWGALATVVVLGLAAGCSTVGTAGKNPAASPGSGGPAGRPCGSTKTAANVPVRVEVARGNVSCSVAMTIEHDYAHAIRSGQEPGNGGGGPVKIDGWTCQGFPTPTVLKTGKTSKCVEDGNEILAVLPDSA